MTKKTPTAWDSDELGRVKKLKDSQPAWRSVLLSGQTDLIDSMMKAGFNADYPVGEEGRSPLIDLALTIPANPEHGEALAEAARILVNSGATLNLPDYKGLTPADYALISPNPLIAREILLATLRNETLKDLEKSYRPQLGVLFCLTVSRPERIAIRANLLDNLAEIKDALNHKNIKDDPLLMEQDRENLEYWLNFEPPAQEDLPAPSTALRQLFRRVAAMTAQAEDDELTGRQVFSAEDIENAKSHFRFQEWRHAQNFHI
ncbi:MAG: hypothetical protein ACXW4B_09840 [Micavibrio sp.]